MIKAIIFDADGVVIDTEPLYDKADIEFFSRFGVKDGLGKYRHFLTGRSLEDGIAYMQKIYGFPGVVAELTDERVGIIKKHYSQVTFVPEFLNFFNTVKEKYKVAIATSSNVELFAIADSELHLTDLFKGHVYYLKDVGGVSKPAPDIFLHAAKMLGVAPQDCMVIEDAINGIKAAKAAGMKCIGLATTHEASMLTEADIVVKSFDEINLE